jgi:dolichol-phosphate mannosyltransferase
VPSDHDRERREQHGEDRAIGERKNERTHARERERATERGARLAGDTHFIFYKTKVLKNFISGIISFSDAPAYFPLIAGLALCAVTALALPLAAVAIVFGSKGPWLLALLLLASSAVQLVSIGLVGIYVAKILQNVRGRPRYVVDGTVGFGDDG